MSTLVVPTLVPGPNGTTIPYRNLPAISNFVGSVGVAPQGTAPNARAFLISAFTIEGADPPLLACGAPGCGQLWIDGEQPLVTATKWTAFEATRFAEQTATGVVVISRNRSMSQRYFGS